MRSAHAQGYFAICHQEFVVPCRDLGARCIYALNRVVTVVVPSLSRRSWWSTLEWCYATIALFALTQGPVYQLWRASAESLQIVAEPSLGHVHLATFVLVQLPGLVLLARRVPSAWFSQRSLQMLMALLAWLMLTSITSTFARQSIPEVLALGVTACFGLYLVVSFSVRRVLSQVVVAMLAGLTVSYVAVVRLWEGSRNLVDDYWIGIYLNRNSLAPVAAMGMLSAVMLMIDCRPRSRGDTSTFVACLAVVGFSGVMLYLSESATSVAALIITGVVVAVWLGVSRLTNDNANPAQSGRVLAATVVAAALVVGTALTYVAKSASVFGRVETFSARAPIWSMNWSGFLERPLLGWGWQAAWNVPQFLKQGVWWAVPFENNWAHSGYFDLLLGGGVVAGLLFAGWVVVSCLQAAPAGSHAPANDDSQRTSVALSIFVLAAATQESFFIGSHFLWALLVWGLTSAVLGGRVSSRAESPPTSVANAVPAALPR